jgi:flagellar biosynthesis/type III secretory pathway protein FliH
VYQEIGQEYLEKGLEKGLEQGLEKGLEKGRKQGIEQALHQTLMIYVETRFPQLVLLAQQQTGFITDVALLNQIMSTLFSLQTTEEVEQYLRKLGNDATKS